MFWNSGSDAISFNVSGTKEEDEDEDEDEVDDGEEGRFERDEEEVIEGSNAQGNAVRRKEEDSGERHVCEPDRGAGEKASGARGVVS